MARPYDLVLFGATGYTGKLTAEHITKSFPTNLEWAIAGRSASKLEAVAAECKALNSDRSQPAIEICTLTDGELSELSKKTTVLISTVGPYSKYGEHAFKACAENGTHYVDATGEVPWVAKMIRKYEAKAKESGSIMIPQCGIESAPADLITFSLASFIRREVSAPTKEVVLAMHDMRGLPSGGTLATVLELLDTTTIQEYIASTAPYALSPIPSASHTRSTPLLERLFGVRVVPDLGTLTTSLGGSADAPIVQRTWGLLGGRATYGPNFHFSEYMRVRNAFVGFFVHLAITLAPAFLILKPVRSMLKRFVTAPGEGPDRAAWGKDMLEYRAIATADSRGGERAYCKAKYEGGMYYFTGILLAQAALSLLQDDSSPAKETVGGGILTPAMLGPKFIDRLGEQGFVLETSMLAN